MRKTRVFSQGLFDPTEEEEKDISFDIQFDAVRGTVPSDRS